MEVFLFLLYFVPSMMAFINKKENRYSILLGNIVFGWTILGWLILLIWSIKED